MIEALRRMAAELEEGALLTIDPGSIAIARAAPVIADKD
jgi:hypothetical protein